MGRPSGWEEENVELRAGIALKMHYFVFLKLELWWALLVCKHLKVEGGQMALAGLHYFLLYIWDLPDKNAGPATAWQQESLS